MEHHHDQRRMTLHAQKRLFKPVHQVSRSMDESIKQTLWSQHRATLAIDGNVDDSRLYSQDHSTDGGCREKRLTIDLNSKAESLEQDSVIRDKHQSRNFFEDDLAQLCTTQKQQFRPVGVTALPLESLKRSDLAPSVDRGFPLANQLCCSSNQVYVSQRSANSFSQQPNFALYQQQSSFVKRNACNLALQAQASSARFNSSQHGQYHRHFMPTFGALNRHQPQQQSLMVSNCTGRSGVPSHLTGGSRDDTQPPTEYPNEALSERKSSQLLHVQCACGNQAQPCQTRCNQCLTTPLKRSQLNESHNSEMYLHHMRNRSSSLYPHNTGLSLNTTMQQVPINDETQQQILQLKKEKGELSKENAVLAQKLQFLQMQLDEEVAQNKASVGKHEELVGRMREENEEVEQERSNLAQAFEAQSQELEQLKALICKYQETQLGLNSKENQNLQQIENLQNSLARLTQSKQTVEKQLDQEKNDQHELLEQIRADFEQQMQHYAAQITDEQQIAQSLRDELSLLQSTSADSKTKLTEKYKSEIKTLQQSFQAFKKESQSNLETLQREKAALQAAKQHKEELVTRLRSEKKSLAHSNEVSQKSQKEQVEKLQADLKARSEEIKKLRNRVTSLKSNVTRLETLSKKPLQIVLKPSTDSRVATETSFEVLQGKSVDKTREVSTNAGDSDQSTILINVDDRQRAEIAREAAGSTLSLDLCKDRSNQPLMMQSSTQAHVQKVALIGTQAVDLLSDGATKRSKSKPLGQSKSQVSLGVNRSSQPLTARKMTMVGNGKKDSRNQSSARAHHAKKLLNTSVAISRSSATLTKSNHPTQATSGAKESTKEILIDLIEANRALLICQECNFLGTVETFFAHFNQEKVSKAEYLCDYKSKSHCKDLRNVLDIDSADAAPEVRLPISQLADLKIENQTLKTKVDKLEQEATELRDEVKHLLKRALDLNNDLDDQKDMTLQQDKVIKLLLVDDNSAAQGATAEQSKNSTTLVDLAMMSDCSAWNRAMYFDRNTLNARDKTSAQQLEQSQPAANENLMESMQEQQVLPFEEARDEPKPHQNIAAECDTRQTQLFQTPALHKLATSSSRKGHWREQRRLGDVENQFVSKGSYLVRDEEFKGGQRDIREIQKSNFAPSLHSHQQQLHPRATFFAEHSQQKSLLTSILHKEDNPSGFNATSKALNSSSLMQSTQPLSQFNQQSQAQGNKRKASEPVSRKEPKELR